MKARHICLFIFTLVLLKDKTLPVCFQKATNCLDSKPLCPLDVTPIQTYNLSYTSLGENTASCSQWCLKENNCNSFIVLTSSKSLTCSLFTQYITKLTFIKGCSYYRIKNGKYISCISSSTIESKDMTTASSTILTSELISLTSLLTSLTTLSLTPATLTSVNTTLTPTLLASLISLSPTLTTQTTNLDATTTTITTTQTTLVPTILTTLTTALITTTLTTPTTALITLTITTLTTAQITPTLTTLTTALTTLKLTTLTTALITPTLTTLVTSLTTVVTAQTTLSSPTLTTSTVALTTSALTTSTTALTTTTLTTSTIALTTTTLTTITTALTTSALTTFTTKLITLALTTSTTALNTSALTTITPTTSVSIVDKANFPSNFPDADKWQVFQRRCDGSVDFYQNFESYSVGFGDETGEFWKGNEWLSKVTNSNNYRLRIDLEDFEGNMVWAEYEDFRIGSKEEYYTLYIGAYSGTAGDSLTYHNSMPFATFDVDPMQIGCAKLFHGAWWYLKCHRSNLNGKYLAGPHDTFADGVEWTSFRGYFYSLKCVEMKIALI